MSRFATQLNGVWIEEIESMDVCKHRINDTCCNEDCVCLGYCMDTSCDSNEVCDCFEEEDGIIEEE